MNFKIKLVRKLIVLVATMFIYCNAFAQSFVDMRTTNVILEKNEGGPDYLTFTLELKGTEEYGNHHRDCGLRFGGSTVYLEVVQADGTTPAINFVNVTAAPVTLPNPSAIQSSSLNTVVGGAYNRMGILLTKGGVSTDEDLYVDKYRVMAFLRVEIESIISEEAYLKIRTNEGLFSSEWNYYQSAYTCGEFTNSSPIESEEPEGGTPILTDLPSPTQALWLGTTNSNWSDQTNWVDPVSLLTVGVPDENTDVYISGTALNFPLLSGTNRTAANIRCKNITFFPGAQVGRIDLLTYERARVQLGVSSPDDDQLGNNHSFENEFWKFSKSHSAAPLSTGQWHMLTMPLHGIVTGDLAYGGYPATFVRKFNTTQVQANVSAPNNNPVTEGSWMDFSRGTTESFSAAEGLAFYVYGGGLAGGAAGFGRDHISDWTNAANYTGSHPAGGFGLGKTQGIIEFPTYDKPDKLQSHRIQKHENDVSTFYGVYWDTGRIELNEGSYTGGMPKKQRCDSDLYYKQPLPNPNGAGFIPTDWGSDYKFIGDKGDAIALNASGTLNPNNPPQTTTQGGATTVIPYPVSGNGEILVGNPFMSAFDFDAFYAVNGPASSYAMEVNSYRLWNGTEFVTYFCSSETRNTSDGSPFTPYIAPMQGFFITASGWNDIRFDAAIVSTVSSDLHLRSSSGEERNIIRLSASNESGATTNTMIGMLESAEAGYKQGEDITKLFAPSSTHSHLSEVYTLADGTALSMNYIGRSGAIVPIGIRVPATGATALKLKGMNRYDADKIELIDGESGNPIADITGFSEYEHAFDNAEGGYQGDRFYLRIAAATTGIEKIVSNTIQVRKSGEAINIVSSPDDLIKQIQIYDTQGRMLYKNASVNTDLYWVKEQFGKNQVLVVQVATEKNTENIKLKN